MKYNIKFFDYFGKQLKELDGKSKRAVKNKIDLIKKNPYRNKRIHSNSFRKVFRVRLNLRGKELRMIYVVVEPDIILVCFLDRKKDYKDLEKYLEKIR